MYIEVYDRQLNHITNIRNVKFTITKRVFDLDTSTFEGSTDEDISNGLLFVLCDTNGKYLYSGFIKNISQNNKYVAFKGEDYKSVFDTEIVLDYTNRSSAPEELRILFEDVKNALLTQVSEMGNIISFEINLPQYPQAQDEIYWIANYDGQYLVVNANKFLKKYLAYYSYYINPYFDRVNKKLIYSIQKNNEVIDIKLTDFTFESTNNGSAINKTIATIKFDNKIKDQKQWIKTSEIYWNSLDSSKQLYYTAPIELWDEFPQEDANEFDLGFCIKVGFHEMGHSSNIFNYEYFKVVDATIQRPIDLPMTTYYLGKDNNIYQDTISNENLIIPIRTKVFEDEFFDKAQASAISELINSRYNENITITNTMSPINLKDLELYTLINVYDKNGDHKQLPISEIDFSNDYFRIKLGFKKTLLTEVIKQ